jgi:hypothetical protein
MNVRCTPEPIVNAHSPDQRPQFRMDLRPASSGAGFPAPVAAKSSAMPAHQGLWPNDYHGLEDGRTPTIKLDEEQAINVRELDATAHLAPQYNSCCLSAAFSASSRLLDLKGEATRFKKRNISATIVAEVKRFCLQIKRTRFSVHTGRQNFIAVPANHVLSVVPTKYPFGWSGLMPNLFFHQRYPPKIT